MSHTHENVCCYATLTTTLSMSGSLKTHFTPGTTSTSSPCTWTIDRWSPSPLQPYVPDWLYIRSYINMFASTGKVSQGEGNGLTRSDFRDGYTFFGFDLTLDACDRSCCHLLQKGNLRIEIHFAATLVQTINVIAVFRAFMNKYFFGVDYQCQETS